MLTYLRWLPVSQEKSSEHRAGIWNLWDWIFKPLSDLQCKSMHSVILSTDRVEKLQRDSFLNTELTNSANSCCISPEVNSLFICHFQVLPNNIDRHSSRGITQVVPFSHAVYAGCLIIGCQCRWKKVRRQWSSMLYPVIYCWRTHTLRWVGYFSLVGYIIIQLTELYFYELFIYVCLGLLIILGLPNGFLCFQAHILFYFVVRCV